jgi:hypothetical protein
MRAFRLAVLSLAAVSLAGCINSTTLIKVKADGTGTIEQTTLVNMQSLRAMMPGMNQPGAQSNPVDEANLKRTAEKMGQGVRFVSAEPAKANGFEGVHAVFAFDDINQVQISQDPDMSGGTTGPFTPPPSKTDSPITFKLAKQAGNSVLTVTLKDKPVDKADTGASSGNQGGPDMSDPTVMNMVKAMFQGFKVNIDVEVGGPIVKTNAEYVTGSRVTLLDMDMNALFADEAKLKALQSKVSPGASLTEVKPYLKDIKGIKIDGPVVTVEFR